MKILHLITDHQVIERTLGVYENVFPNCNDILIFGNTNEYKHLQMYSNSPLVLRNQGRTYSRSFLFNGYTHIIAHYLTMDMIDFIKEAPQDINVTWEIYGADLYNQFLDPFGLNIYYSDVLKYQKYGTFRKFFPHIFNLALQIIKKCKYQFTCQKHSQFKFIANRVNHLQYCCKYDAKYVEDYIGRTIPSYEIFNYSLDEVLGDLKNIDFFTGKDILVGNSASFSNNHLYILEKIKNLSIDNSTKLILPLSYGGGEKYISEVKTKFDEQFGEQIEVIDKYLPLHIYNKTFLRLNTMILSAWRQESQGTAIMGLYLGIKVFMSNKSPLYKWFKDCGFIVFELECAKGTDINTSLNKDEKQHNRNLVISRYGENVFSKTLKDNIK